MSNKKYPTSSNLYKDNEAKSVKFINDIRKLFSISSEEEKIIFDALRFRLYEKGYIITDTTEIFKNHFFIVKGVARTYYIENGKEYNYSFSFDDEFIMIPYTESQRGLNVFVQFLEDTEICFTSTSNRQKLPSLANEKFHHFVETALINQIKYMESMMIMLRMEAKDRYKWVMKKHPRILESVSLTQLASFLNITKETLYRIRSGKY